MDVALRLLAGSSLLSTRSCTDSRPDRRDIQSVVHTLDDDEQLVLRITEPALPAIATYLGQFFTGGQPVTTVPEP